MLDVFLTVDVEIWCDGWENIDEKFPAAYRKYIEGPTASGDYGLAYQLKVLSDHGLTGVFFVEPLFAARFGAQPLADIVGLIEAAGHEVQLHLHTEWVDEAAQPLLPDATYKRQHMRYFSRADQATLIRTGADMLARAGARPVNAFRAGSFGFNRDTLLALADNGIGFDSSYNASMMGLDSGVMPGVRMTEPAECDGVHEYPMTVFNDGTKTLRHAQLTSCSAAEMEGLLWQAVAQGRSAFVVLSHCFELLNPAKNRVDPVVLARFHKLCAFLDKHRGDFRTTGFHGLSPSSSAAQPAPLTSPLYRTGLRMAQQAYRMRFQ
ncbi:MAG: polysaccharide deacetylase [Massilia sp.]|jgi:peptidoglycan/xylan/chitin deacetylase (PgdA/CDA1 family)|nr:polysaccharide deacetylase [Massilia sp.]